MAMVILAGLLLMAVFGLFGRLARGHSLSIIDSDPQAIRDAQEFGFKVWYGDGARMDILHAAGAGEAGLIIAAAGDRAAVTRMVELARHEYPLVPVLARAFDREHARELVAAGAAWQIRETFESAMEMGREALVRLGDSPEDAAETLRGIRERDRDRFALETAQGFQAGRALLHGNAGQEGGGH